MKVYYITGNTFEHRDEIRRSGAEWNSEKKRWELSVQDHGFKRNDGEVYRLRKLRGLKVEHGGNA
jgi:hypothetical protein